MNEWKKVHEESPPDYGVTFIAAFKRDDGRIFISHCMRNGEKYFVDNLAVERPALWFIPPKFYEDDFSLDEKLRKQQGHQRRDE